jgi:hypothetical protein
MHQRSEAQCMVGHVKTSADAPKESTASKLQLLDFTITPSGLNPLGSLSAGRLRLSGLLKSALSAEPARNKHYCYLFDLSGIGVLDPSSPQIGRICFDIPIESEPQLVYCLSVINYGMLGPGALNGGLAPVPTGQVENEFKRIGVVQLDDGWFDGCEETTIN